MPNYSVSVFLINNDVRGVLGTYEPDTPSKTERRVFLKTLDPSIKKDDLVIVSAATRWGYTVFKITDVDVEPNFDSHDDVGWIVGKVDTRRHQEILAQEAEAIAVMQRAERRKKREEMRKTLMADTEELKTLAITSPIQPVSPPPFRPSGTGTIV